MTIIEQVARQMADEMERREHYRRDERARQREYEAYAEFCWAWEALCESLDDNNQQTEEW